MSTASLAVVTRIAETSLIGISKLDEFGIITYNPLIKSVLMPVEQGAAGAGSSQASGSRGVEVEEHVRIRPNMTMTEMMQVLMRTLGPFVGTLSS